MNDLTSAAFYYDYENKQVRTKVIDQIFGPVEAHANVPKSRIGASRATSRRARGGSHLSVAGTYIKSKVTSKFQQRKPGRFVGDFNGSKLPFTPRSRWLRTYSRDGSHWRMKGSSAAPLPIAADEHDVRDGRAARGDFTLPTSNVLDVRVG